MILWIPIFTLSITGVISYYSFTVKYCRDSTVISDFIYIMWMILILFYLFVGDVDPTILISIRTPNNSAISDFCGLCGSRSGSLLRRDGTEADATSMAEVQSFATSYAVPARDQILRPQRRECGKLQY